MSFIGPVSVLATIVLFFVLAYRQQRRARDGDVPRWSRYGQVPVPGRVSVPLPRGRVKLTYVEDRSVTRPPRRLRIEVVSPTGERLELHDRWWDEVYGGVPRLVIGFVRVADAGTYTVTTAPELPDAGSPRVLLGP